jgi:dipeptidyl aminopeptidase/acylaminoacyl peptidase
VPPRNSILFYEALIKNNVPAELHIYTEGGHGFSLAIGKPHLEDWPETVIDWIFEVVVRK